jgi:ribose/xylose/arabinose/galactoside ABC-type transport system permease subunit
MSDLGRRSGPGPGLGAGSAAAALLRPGRRGWDAPELATLAVYLAAIGLLAYGAADTSGFVTVANLKAILTSTALVGIIAVGMTAIMISGNLFSLSVGQTAAVTAMLFLYALRLDLGVAIALGVLLGLGICAVQGAIVGYLKANTIIVTIGAGLLQAGVATWLSNGNSIVPPAGSTSYVRLSLPLLGIPFAVYVFFAIAILVEFLLRATRFGRMLYLMGENRRAARAAALPVALLTTGAVSLAGA